jgi:hypothetical protein
MFLLLSAGRDCRDVFDARVPDGGAEGATRTEAAVSRAASVWSGLSGLDLIATRRRLVRDGKVGGGRLATLLGWAATRRRAQARQTGV